MTLTYCKALPTPIDELNAIGKTQIEMFLSAYAPIFHKAVCETVNFMMSGEQFNKSHWNTHLQTTYGISKRHANGVISSSKGAVDSAKECRISHIKTLEGKAKSCENWLKKTEKKLKNARKFYAKKNWQNSKTGGGFPLSSSLKYRQTNWQNIRFQIHNKKRKLTRYRQILAVLKSIPVRVHVPKNQAFIVGSKDESHGNQVCQWDGDNLRVRVPACLESKFGKYVESKIGDFPRNINRLPATGAKTWHFYYKDDKWCAAVNFTPSEVRQASRSVDYGCIGIDMNPGSIGWAYIDAEGNLKSHSQIPFQTGLPKGQQQAMIVKACLELAALATKYQCPIVCEDLDFTSKKEQLRELGKKYARMLSLWAYSEFFKLLNSILSNRGKRRWQIEGWFKTAKHRFGLHRFGQGSLLGMYRWLILSLIAYLIAHWTYLLTQRSDLPDWGEAAQTALECLFPQILVSLFLLDLERLIPLIRSLGFDIHFHRCKI